MKKLIWCIKKIWQLPYQYTLNLRWQDRYRATKLALGLPGVHDCSKFTKINTLDKGNRDAFLRAIIVEISDYNRNLYLTSPNIILWGHLSKVLDKLGVMGMQKEVYHHMKHLAYKAVSSFDIKNFESNNPEDNMII